MAERAARPPLAPSPPALLRGLEGLTASWAQALDGVVGRWVHGDDDPPCCGGATAAAFAAPAPGGADGERSGLDEVARLQAEAATLSRGERYELEILSRVEPSLERGRELKAWWEAVAEPQPGERSFADRFELERTFNEPSQSFGFFDVAPVAGAELPVMGNYQEVFYDQPKEPHGDRRVAADWMRDQMREFVLRYFMRVSDFSAPTGFTDTWRPPLSNALSLLSWCPRQSEQLRGFGFRQLMYKERDGGRIGRFADEEAYRIVDLRELRRRFEWIVVEVSIFDFRFSVAPFGAGGPELSLPLQESSHLVLAADLIEELERPAPGVLGRYGIGYAFIPEPHQGVVAYGPGRFEAALELIRFDVAEDGSVRVPMVFIANRPSRVVDLDLDPIGAALDAGVRAADLATAGVAAGWLAVASRLLHALPRPRLRFDPVLSYVRLANLVSGGQASDYLCIDRRQLEKEFLVKHYMQHYQTITGSLATWRLVADWFDTAKLPEWVREGRQP